MYATVGVFVSSRARTACRSVLRCVPWERKGLFTIDLIFLQSTAFDVQYQKQFRDRILRDLIEFSSNPVSKFYFDNSPRSYGMFCTEQNESKISRFTTTSTVEAGKLKANHDVVPLETALKPGLEQYCISDENRFC